MAESRKYWTFDRDAAYPQIQDITGVLSPDGSIVTQGIKLQTNYCLSLNIWETKQEAINALIEHCKLVLDSYQHALDRYDKIKLDKLWTIEFDSPTGTFTIRLVEGEAMKDGSYYCEDGWYGIVGESVFLTKEDAAIRVIQRCESLIDGITKSMVRMQDMLYEPKTKINA